MSSYLEICLYIVSSGFIVWVTGLGGGVTIRFFRNIISSASNPS
jgi:hypothetical protein